MIYRRIEELEEGRTYSTVEACSFAGVSYRQADYWIRKGLIPLMERSVGSGSPRRWSADQVRALHLIADKLDQAQAILEEIGLSIPGHRQKTLAAA